MPIVKPKLRSAKRIDPKTLNKMRIRTGETKVLKDLKKVIDGLGKTNHKLQEKLEEDAIKINRFPRKGNLRLKK